MFYKSTAWLQIEASKLNDHFLASAFLADFKQAVYVVDKKGILDGIITLGNFRRHVLSGKPLIQKQFSFVSEQNEDCIRDIFKNNNKILSVPVLDKEHHIIKEYRRACDAEEEAAISNDIIFKLYRQLMADSGKNLLITRLKCVTKETGR